MNETEAADSRTVAILFFFFFFGSALPAYDRPPARVRIRAATAGYAIVTAMQHPTH